MLNATIKDENVVDYTDEVKELNSQCATIFNFHSGNILVVQQPVVSNPFLSLVRYEP